MTDDPNKRGIAFLHAVHWLKRLDPVSRVWAMRAAIAWDDAELSGLMQNIKLPDEQPQKEILQ